jgi:hypothetical protein
MASAPTPAEPDAKSACELEALARRIEHELQEVARKGAPRGVVATLAVTHHPRLRGGEERRRHQRRRYGDKQR